MKAILLFAGVALASWTKNLNYRSPSEHHPSLGISLHRVNKRNVVGSDYAPGQLNFTHGVASGDPHPYSVILWTRASPQLADVNDNSSVSGLAPLYGHGVYNNSKPSTAPVCVQYRIADCEDFSNVVDSDVVYTSSDIDYTVKVEAKNLKPYTQYWYQFNICNSKNYSPIGRTKTTPRQDDSTTNVGLAVYSCSNFPFGFFNAFGNPARKDSVDYIVHLGDYIYEYAGNGDYGNGSAIGRVPQPERIIYTLYDYRTRYATYRTDADLLLSHQQFPWIPVWDDHEVADNTYRDGSSLLNNTEDSFVRDGGVSVDQRKMNAVRAYFEWMPIRQVDMDDNLRVWRSFSIGNLFDLIMLDTRQYDRSITDLYWNTGYIHDISNDAGRSMMGPRQENWFYHQLGQSSTRGATWRVVGSQTVFSRINESAGTTAFADPFDRDAWDGYLANRNRTLSYLYDNNIGNNIFISGDSHASWVSDLVWIETKDYNSSTGVGAIGAEFAGSAVSSPPPVNLGLNASNVFSQKLVDNDNPALQWQDLYYRGYFELHISPEKVDAEYFGMPTIVTRNSGEISLANFTVKAGDNRLQRPISNGRAESGGIKGGQVVQTNVTLDTGNGTWSVWKSNLPEEGPEF
ncbi:phosphodiesterase/alkaline phosphatase D precursor [Myriangium duriaei CBS 260.36]|uniref:Phosphodiesterase/alkaline phosphatase D n=1 Tax=Myriangium duriaei CBS 260.36 TaxID=1168546 RepID=A0A9P4IVL2_9PEZI|nr:phosphodiesterase/alkaline phosphatase D precursor [Myriangium duriaei CBS 260.36]